LRQEIIALEKGGERIASVTIGTFDANMFAVESLRKRALLARAYSIALLNWVLL
jgi:hypothetical protein